MLSTRLRSNPKADQEIYDSLVDFIMGHPGHVTKVSVTKDEAQAIYRHLIRKNGTDPIFVRQAEDISSGKRRLRGAYLLIDED